MLYHCLTQIKVLSAPDTASLLPTEPQCQCCIFMLLVIRSSIPGTNFWFHHDGLYYTIIKNTPTISSGPEQQMSTLLLCSVHSRLVGIVLCHLHAGFASLRVWLTHRGGQESSEGSSCTRLSMLRSETDTHCFCRNSWPYPLPSPLDSPIFSSVNCNSIYL